MNLNPAMLHSLWTIVLMVTFVVIVIRTFSAKRRGEFDEAARLAVDDEPDEQLPVHRPEVKQPWPRKPRANNHG